MNRIIQEDDWNKCTDENALMNLLKKYELNKYVEYGDVFKYLEEKYPILRTLKVDNVTYSSVLMNTCLQQNVFPFNGILSPFTINLFLNLYYEDKK